MPRSSRFVGETPHDTTDALARTVFAPMPLMRPNPGRGTSQGDPTDRELAAIARHLAAVLPRSQSPPPPRRAAGPGRSLALYLAGSLVPGLVLVAVMLLFGPPA